MRLFGKTTPDLESTREQILAERLAAHSRLAALIEGRRETELYGEFDELVANDKGTERERLVIARCDARLAQIERDRASLEHEAEQTRRRERYDSAKKSIADGRAALSDYEKAASAAASALQRYAAVRMAIVAANADLPDGVKPLVDPEPDNSVGLMRAENGFPIAMAAAHLSILDAAVLPKLSRGKFYFGAANVAPVGFHR